MKEIVNSQFNPAEYSVVIVDFWADWCMPCKILAPTLDKLSSEINEVTFLKANVEENTSLVKQYGISGIPALLIFKGGQIVNKLVGLQNEAKIRDALAKALA